MRIFVKTLSEKIFTLEVEPTDRLEDVKDKIYEQEGIPQYQQRLVFEGKCVEDHNTIQDYCIYKDKTLTLIIRTSKNDNNNYF